MLDLRGVSLLADYFIICSGGSERQISAIEADITRAVRGKEPKRRVRKEGRPSSGWVLLDYGDVVVHIFGAEERDYYALEELWSDARPVVQIQ